MDYDKAIEYDPENKLACNNRGFAYYKLGYRRQALNDSITSARLGYKIAQEALTSAGIDW
jgi:hypothetical protein